MRGLQSYYQGKGWRAGPHLFIAEDGIWLFTPMNKTGIHAGRGNYRSIGIEVVGDYDTQKWDGATKKNAIGAIRALSGRLDINNEAIKFHRDYSSKSCPGHSITKEWLFSQLAVDPDVPDWQNVVGKKSAKDIWNKSIDKKYLSHSSKFNQNFTKGEAMIILARMFYYGIINIIRCLSTRCNRTISSLQNVH
jgi:N-acetylmuramoyl-L-alanine amidase CwlA